MDNIEKQFEDFIRNIKFDDAPSTNHRDKLERDLLIALARQSRRKRQVLQIWKTLMKTKTAKFATAAVITLAVILLITLFGQTDSPAWAIEQSIEALDRFWAVSVEGWETERTWEENGSMNMRPFRSWAVANKDQTKVRKYRTEVEDYLVLTTNGQKTWRYDPNTNMVRVENEPYNAGDFWCGSRFLQQLKEAHDKWLITKWQITYGKDPVTGKERAFLSFSMPEGPPSPRSLRIEFDIESKLPVSLKQWENPNWEGPADLIAETITYHENLPDDLFEYEIPEGAKVIEY
jgi:outer membrane lipoprotein-sorting protein